MLNKQRITNKALEAFKLCQGIAPDAKSMIIKCDLLANGAAEVSIRVNDNFMHAENHNFHFTPADLDLPYLFTIEEIEQAYTLAAKAICDGLKEQNIDDKKIHSTDLAYQAARPALLCMLMDIEKARYTGDKNE